MEGFVGGVALINLWVDKAAFVELRPVIFFVFFKVFQQLSGTSLLSILVDFGTFPGYNFRTF